ncbi:Fc receptor, IgE, high affinity I, gamma polypeptide like [Platichthys flesus]|uniref:Fc receptor, IgE, high affinity I, gamma polypeptide like n=1 Tax=Platichthys flesus TaxID=8260 RepID=UPI002DBD2275|nr:Fc receptor, IgE, high affinity I, gamma polypeptide like [Platichthys flesus]
MDFMIRSRECEQDPTPASSCELMKPDADVSFLDICGLATRLQTDLTFCFPVNCVEIDTDCFTQDFNRGTPLKEGVGVGGSEAGVWFLSYQTDRELRTSCSLLPELTSEALLTDTRATAAPTLRLICSTPPAGIIDDMNVCYILDGILILYGLILTVLYCRLRMVPDNNHPEKQPVKGGIYEGLRAPSADTYETIGKKAIV